jgi:hypothetical protein
MFITSAYSASKVPYAAHCVIKIECSSQPLREPIHYRRGRYRLEGAGDLLSLAGLSCFFLATKELICKESFLAFKRPWLRFRLGLSLPCVGVESFNQRLLCLKPYALAAALAFT